MKTGGEYSFNYADLADIFRVILPVLGKHGLALSQPLVHDANGKLRMVTRLMLGESAIESAGLPIPEQLEPQDLGTLLSYYRRYDVCLLLAIAPDESQSGNVSSPRTARTPSPSPTQAAPDPVNETVLAYIVDVTEDKGIKTGRSYQWVTFSVAGGKQTKAICEDGQLFAAIAAARTHDAVLTMQRRPEMSYARIIAIAAPE